MKKIWMWLAAAGCAMAVTAVAEDAAPAAAGAPKAPDGGYKGMHERGRGMMMEGRDFGEGMIMRALAPDSPIAKELGLTKEQIEALKGVMRSASEELKGLHEKMQAAARKQAEMMSANTPDEAAVLKGVEEIGALRTQIAKVTTRQILAAQKILTVEQRAELRGMIKARMGEMRERMQEKMGQGEGKERVRKSKNEGGAPVPAAPPPGPAPVE